MVLLTAFCGILVFNWVTKQNENRILNQKEELAVKTKELEIKNEKLLDATEDLKKTNDRLERFAQVVSHDLKSPLRSIISFSQLALNESQKPESNKPKITEHLNYISTNGIHLARIIDDVLHSTHIEGKKHRHHHTPVHLTAVISNIKSVLSELIKAKNGVLTFNPALRAVNAPPTDMRRLFQNFIENGLKYNELKRPHVHIDFKRVNNQIHYSETDNGVGIDPKNIENIFLYKKRATNTKNEGTGLGLYTCSEIIQSLDAKLKVEHLENGSRFVVIL